MYDFNNWLMNTIRWKVDKAENTKELSYVAPRILLDPGIIRNLTKISEYFKNAAFSSFIEDLFENISRIGIVFIFVGAICFFIILASCCYCYWFKYLRPYRQYKKVSTEYDELLSDVFAHDNLTDYEGDSEGSLDSFDELNNEGIGKLELRTMPFASKDGRLSLSEING